MRTETVWLRAAYPAWARMPRGRMGWRAVSEWVRVEVPVIDSGDAPVALRIERPMPVVTRSDAELWLGETRDRNMPQRFEVRAGVDCMLAPILEPDGQTVVGASRLSTLVDRVSHGREQGRYGLRRCPAWEAYPGARPTHAHDPEIPKGTWPEVTSDSVNRPLWDCPDVTQAGFAAVDQGRRDEALAAYCARVAGLRIVDGELWRPCGTPVVMTNLMSETHTRHLIVPGLDPDPLGPVRPLDVVAAVDYRSPMPGQATFAVESVLEVPRADVVRTNLVALALYVERHLGDTPYRDLPSGAMPLLCQMKELRARVDSAADLSEVEADICRSIRGAGHLLRTPQGATCSFSRIEGPLARWVAVVEAERTLAFQDLGSDPDVLSVVM